MTKVVKALIEKSEDYKLGKPLDSIYIISTNKLYNGFWGKNGFNGIIILGRGYKEDKLYYINKSYEADVVDFSRLGSLAQRCRIEIPHDSNCIHIWFNSPVCFNELLSNMQVSVYQEGGNQ